MITNIRTERTKNDLYITTNQYVFSHMNFDG